jgi:hypothetical protein
VSGQPSALQKNHEIFLPGAWCLACWLAWLLVIGHWCLRAHSLTSTRVAFFGGTGTQRSMSTDKPAGSQSIVANGEVVGSIWEFRAAMLHHRTRILQEEGNKK